LAGRLRSMEPRSSAASTVASHVALWAARYTSHDDSGVGPVGWGEGRFDMAAVSARRSAPRHRSGVAGYVRRKAKEAERLRGQKFRGHSGADPICASVATLSELLGWAPKAGAAP
jgi:hypothetical protein